MEYKIVSPDENNRDRFCVCLEDWSAEMAEAGDGRSRWYERMKDRGLGAKMVEDGDGTLAGMIQYLPADYAPVSGGNYYFIYCIWVHGHRQGIGDRRGRGMGQALLRAAEEDVRSRGASGLAAWGLSLPFWMRASWFRKQGYRTVQREGMRELLWKPFAEGAEEPRWLEKSPLPEEMTGTGGPVRIHSFVNGICPVSNLANVRAAAVASRWGDRVEFGETDTLEPKILRRWGRDNALYVNGRELTIGPPITEKKIDRAVRKELRKNKRF